jgi:hypothetical protein
MTRVQIACWILAAMLIDVLIMLAMDVVARFGTNMPGEILP